MFLKIIILNTALIFTSICIYSQNLVGYKETEIKKYMKENRSDMNLNNVNNSIFKYLKYSDNYDNQTLLFFLNQNSVCKSVRMICNAAAKESKVKEFDSIYKRVAENRWTDKHNGKDYRIELREEKWSCIITIEPDK